MTPQIISDGEIARRIMEFGKIRHHHRELGVIHRAIELARAEVRSSRAETAVRQGKTGVRVGSDPFPVITIFGSFGTAKSHTVKTYKEDFAEKEDWPDGKRLVVDFELSIDANKRQFQVDALTGFGDPDPEKGNESVLRRRVSKLAFQLGTEVTFVDETQHFVDSDTRRKRMSVGNAMKKFVNAGISALVLLGTDEASGILETNLELADRIFRRFDMKGADLDNPGERQVYRSFLQTFRAGIETRGILTSAAILETGETVGLLAMQTEGKLGTTVRITKAAVRVALQEGATSLLPSHYATAIARGKFGEVNFFAGYADAIAESSMEIISA